MKGLDRYPDWPPGTRHTDPNAQVCRFRSVTNGRAVRIANGSYRNANVSGVFELDDSAPQYAIESYLGTPRVKVMCAWLGYKPSRSCARIDVSGATVEVLENYSGEVADNIGYPTDPAPLD